MTKDIEYPFAPVENLAEEKTGKIEESQSEAKTSPKANIPPIMKKEIVSQEIKKEERKESRRKNCGVRPDFNKGYRGELIRLLLTSGVVPLSGLHMLEKEQRMYVRKLKDMEKEGIVEVVRYGRKKIARLVRYASVSETYIDSLGEVYHEHYVNYANRNAKYLTGTTQPTAREKAYREGEITALMYGADINVLPDKKPAVTTDEKIKENESAYYNSLEIKDGNNFELKLDDETAEEGITASRIIGCVISPGGAYAVYHTGKKPLVWSKMNEGLMAYSILKIATRKNTKKVSLNQKSCIMFGCNDEVFFKIMTWRKPRLLNIECGYNKMYALYYDKTGKQMMSIMKDAGWEKKIINYCIPDYEKNTRHSAIDCDGIKNTKHALVFCVPDLIRLYKFLSALSFVLNSETKKENFEVYCFSFQVPLVKLLVNNMAVIKEIDFDEFLSQRT